MIPTGGIPPYQVLWSTGSTNDAIVYLSSGAYGVTVTDDNGCSLKNNFNILVGVELLTLAGTEFNSPCAGANAGSVITTVSGGTLPFSYTWSNGATTPSLAGLGPGSYTVWVSDVDGQTYFKAFFIQEPFSPLAISTLTGPEFPIGAANGYANALASGGVPPYTYLWSNGATTTSIDQLSAATYTVTVTDDYGCSVIASDSVYGGIFPIQSTSILTNPTCFGSTNGSIEIGPSSGLPPYQVL
ncbi:MAG: SprB repeat-containing protein [Flavobacteriales bacterium]|nr:SprB repeat-containing protein [Flavobacteriales bacterium]